MTTLETALAAAGFRILGEELVEWLKNKGDDVAEDDWARLGRFVDRKLRVDYKNIEASRLTKSRKRSAVRKIESSAEIYRELALIGEERNFAKSVVKMYSNLADVCINWSTYTESFGTDQYTEWAQKYFDISERYREVIE